MGARLTPHPGPLPQGEREQKPPSLAGGGWGRGAAALAVTLALNGCGTPTACLANRYDATAPQARCISGVQLPGNILKDTDPMSGSTAPVTVAR